MMKLTARQQEILDFIRNTAVPRTMQRKNICVRWQRKG